MYLQYWGMRERPFENSLDTRFFFHSQQHDNILAKLLYVVENRLGAAALTGTFGCGKTFIIRSLLNQLSPEQFKTSLIINPIMDADNFLLTIVRQLGGTDLPNKKSELLASDLQAKLGHLLEDNYRNGQDTVVVVDEAHLIEDQRIFELLRILLNFQSDTRYLLTLILAGQPELREKIENQKSLEQRLALKGTLGTLSQDDAKNYILHRIQTAGCTRGVFTKAAAELVVANSGGIPQRINRICDMALLSGFGMGIGKIGPDIVEMVIKDIEGITG